MNDISEYSFFVMSGSMWSIREAFEPLFDMAVFMTAPAIIRAERLRARAFARWGNRVLPGGDMYEANETHKDYFEVACRYETDESPKLCLKQHEQWADELPCLVLRVDGTKSTSENVELIVDKFFSIRTVD